MVVLTEKDREAWHELDNVEAIPNPLPFDVCNISNQESKQLLLVGRYSHEKGIDLMLEAWAKLQGKCSDWTLDIFGDGDREPYILQAKQLGIDMTRCHLNGRTDDVRREYANSAMLVCTSRFEGFGMVIAEAMACGLPVVSFDCPWGPRSIISDGEDGTLVTNGNVDDLVSSILKMVNDSELRHNMSMKAVENIKRFNIDNIAEKWRLLFESL